MNVDMMLEWAAALESGEYKQGQGKLHNLAENSHDVVSSCCLGVACLIFADRVDIVREGDSWLWSDHGSTEHALPTPLYELMYGSMGSKQVRLQGRLRIPDHLLEEHDLNDLTRAIDPAFLNDSFRCSFEEIAECIRYTVEKYLEETNG